MPTAKKGDFFDDLEEMSPQEREAYQTTGLREALEHAYRHAPSAKAIFDKAGVKPSAIRTVKDLEKLPITRKGDLIELQRSQPPYGGFVACSSSEVDRVFITPGPLYGPHQSEGISWFGKTIYAAGFRAGDMVINTPSYHMSPAGILFHEGVRACGATVVPTGVGNTDAQIRTMLDLKVTGYTGMPSFLMTIIKRAEELGHDVRRDFALKRAWFTGEMLAPTTRKELEEGYGIDTYQCYAVTDLGGCVAYECSEKAGMHFMDEYVIEIVDPETFEPVAPGDVGELVVTTLTKEAFPVIRYRTRDLARLLPEPCPCGRTLARMSRVLGRTDDMLIIKGVNVYPSQIEGVLFEIEGTHPHYQLIVEREGRLDKVTVHVEVVESIFFDQMKKQREMIDRIKRRLATELGIGVEVKLVGERTLARSDGKAQRVIDKREL